MKLTFILIILFVFSKLIFAQTDWKKWNGHKVSYALSPSSEMEKQTTESNDFASISQKIYKNLFSNYDGNNCAFYPSCSSFFVQAVHKTDFVNGTLLFIDRFTRDMNFAKGFDNYPLYEDGYFYDPVEKYVHSPSN